MHAHTEFECRQKHCAGILFFPRYLYSFAILAHCAFRNVWNISIEFLLHKYFPKVENCQQYEKGFFLFAKIKKTIEITAFCCSFPIDGIIPWANGLTGSSLFLIKQNG